MKRQLSNAVNSRHARIILLSTGGVGNQEIALRLGVTSAWVRRILHRSNQGGLDAVRWCPFGLIGRSGPRKFMADVVGPIAEVALSPPKELIGMPCMITVVAIPTAAKNKRSPIPNKMVRHRAFGLNNKPLCPRQSCLAVVVIMITPFASTLSLPARRVADIGHTPNPLVGTVRT